AFAGMTINNKVVQAFPGVASVANVATSKLSRCRCRSRMKQAHRLAAFLASCLLAGTGHAIASVMPPTLQDCDMDGFAATLAGTAQAPALPARAHWLDRRLVRWPGMVADGRFRLYHARHGGIVAAPGKPV